MGHKKLIKFRAIETYKNVLQHPENMKGNWSKVFGNSNAITLELACGKGEYSLGLGRQHSDRNFLGVDIKGNRIYTGAKTALEEGLTNVAYLRTHISHITNYFGQGEVEEIWIIFPDPFLKKESNRLTHARYLHLYEQILKPGARINLKTDSKELYDFTLQTIAEQDCYVHENIADIYGQGKATGPLAIQTFYEKMHLAEGRTIYFISFSLPEKGVQLTGRFNKERLPDEIAPLINEPLPAPEAIIDPETIREEREIEKGTETEEVEKGKEETEQQEKEKEEKGKKESEEELLPA